MNTWQHQQQLDEQERLEEIERLLEVAEYAMDVHFNNGAEWRKEIEAAIGLPKRNPVSDMPERMSPDEIPLFNSDFDKEPF